MNTSAAGTIEFAGHFRESLTGELAAKFATVPSLPPGVGHAPRASAAEKVSGSGPDRSILKERRLAEP